MIIIFSSKNDTSTDEVSSWLTHLGENHKVVFSEDLLDNISMSRLNAGAAVQYLESVFTVKLSELKVIWCRKWDLSDFVFQIEFDAGLSNESVFKLRNALLTERKQLFLYLMSLLPGEKIINPFYAREQFKLNQLAVASKLGLKIPETFVLSNLEQLQAISESGKSYITKPVADGFGLEIDNKSYSTLTSRVELSKISTEQFFPSLIQREITKRFEVRTFILGQKTYSIAIFSQSNAQTMVDFRQYDAVNPNKIAYFQLPSEIEDKLLAFCEELGLKTGSADLIVTNDNDYYFLEINPYGQFGMVSKPANLNLEKEIAIYLMNYGNN